MPIDEISDLWKLVQSEIHSEVSTRDMADDLGYDKDETFRRYYIGQSYPNIDMCIKIGTHYGVDPFDLFKKVQQQKIKDSQSKVK